MDAESMAFMIGAFIGALVAGSLCGLAPLIIGIKRGRQFLGIVAMISCIIGGFLLGFLLAAPVAVIFTVVLLCLPKVEPIEEFASAEAEPGGGTPAQPAAPVPAAPTRQDDGTPRVYGRPVAPDPFVKEQEPAVRYAESESVN